MRKLVIWTSCLLLLCLAAAAPAPAQEQGKEPAYIYVAQWAVPRAQWGEMTKLNDQQRPVLEKLVAEGTLTGYGEFSSLAHQEGAPSHGSWFVAKSMGGVLKALEAFYARPDLTAPVLANSKHWDYFLVTRHYGAHSGGFKNAYLVGSNWQVKPGQGREFTELMGKALLPVFDKLLADGVIHWYSVNWETIHSESPGRAELVYIPVDAAAVDKAEAAVSAEIQKNPALGAAFVSMVDMSSHRDFLLWIPNMKNK